MKQKKKLAALLFFHVGSLTTVKVCSQNETVVKHPFQVHKLEVSNANNHTNWLATSPST